MVCSALVSLECGEIPKSYDETDWSLIAKVDYIIQPLFVMAFSLPKVALAIILVRTKRVRMWQVWIVYSLISSQLISALVAIILDLVRRVRAPAKTPWDSFGRGLPFDVLMNYGLFLGGKTHLLVASFNA